MNLYVPRTKEQKNSLNINSKSLDHAFLDLKSSILTLKYFFLTQKNPIIYSKNPEISYIRKKIPTI